MDILSTVHEADHIENGVIPAGFLFASIKNTGSATAQVNGVELAKGEAKTYPFVGKGYTALPFSVQGSTLRIMYIL